jgi:hypothetical protein
MMFVFTVQVYPYFQRRRVSEITDLWEGISRIIFYDLTDDDTDFADVVMGQGELAN